MGNYYTSFRLLPTPLPLDSTYPVGFTVVSGSSGEDGQHRENGKKKHKAQIIVTHKQFMLGNECYISNNILVFDVLTYLAQKYLH